MGRRALQPGALLRHAALCAPVLLFFAPAIFFGRALYLRDTGLYFYPHKALIAQALRAGRLPQWNPFEYGGVPLLADPNFNVFHPLSLLTWLVPLPLGFTLFVAACALAGAWGGRALGRALGLSEGGALLAGLAFAWSGPFVSLLESGQCVAPAFLPWLCAAGAQVGLAASGAPSPERRQGLRRAAALAAVAAALVFLSGTPEIGGCALGLAALLSLATAERGARLRALAWLGGALALGAALAALQLWPTAEFLQRSSRAGGIALAQATSLYSLHPLRLPGLAFPFFAGEPDAPGTPQWLLDPSQPPYVQELYAGALVLLLAAHGLSRAGRGRARLVLLAACGALLLLSFGAYTPLFALARAALPPLRLVRFPEKLVLPLALAIAVCAGAGWDRLAAAAQAARPARGLIAGAAVLGALGVLAWGASLRPDALAPLLGLLSGAGSLQRDGSASAFSAARAACLCATALPSLATEALFAALALGLLALRARAAISLRLLRLGLAAAAALDLALPAARLDYTIPAEELTAPSPLAQILERDAGAPLATFRVSAESLGLSTAHVDSLFEPSWPRPRKLFALRHSALLDAGAALAGVYEDRGYSGFTPGPLRALYTANGKAVLDLLGVRYLVQIGSGQSPPGRLGLVPAQQLLGGELRVWRNPDAAPRLRLVSALLAPRTGLRLPPCAERDAVWVERADGNPAFASDPLALAADCAHLAAEGEAAGTARLLRYDPERVEAEVDAPGPRLAVLSDNGDPGWSATLDGAPAPALLADGVLRAVAVPAGQHRIAWTYRAPGLDAGAMISLAALAALLWLAFPPGAHGRSLD